MQDAGLAFCYPDVSATDEGLEVDGLFDLVSRCADIPLATAS